MIVMHNGYTLCFYKFNMLRKQIALRVNTWWSVTYNSSRCARKKQMMCGLRQLQWLMAICCCEPLFDNLRIQMINWDNSEGAHLWRRLPLSSSLHRYAFFFLAFSLSHLFPSLQSDFPKGITSLTRISSSTERVAITCPHLHRILRAVTFNLSAFAVWQMAHSHPSVCRFNKSSPM